MSPEKKSAPVSNVKANLDKLKKNVNMLAKPVGKIAATLKPKTTATATKTSMQKTISMDMNE